MKWKKRLKYLLSRCHFFPGGIFLKMSFRLLNGKKLNLKNPRTFNEKLNWLKLNSFGNPYWRSDYPRPNCLLADKFKAREFVSFFGGEAVEVLPLLGVYDSVDDIDWNTLPNDIILKCTHGSHCSILMTQPTINGPESEDTIRYWMKKDWYEYALEPSYIGIKPRIIIQPRLKTEGILPIEYKVMCFDGIAKYVQVHQWSRGFLYGGIDPKDDHRNWKHYIDYYTIEGKRIDCKRNGYPSYAMEHALAADPFLDTDILPKLRFAAESLAIIVEAPYVRVDLFYEDDTVYFNEFTFFDGGGFGELSPDEMNLTFGDGIHLMNEKEKENVS